MVRTELGRACFWPINPGYEIYRPDSLDMTITEGAVIQTCCASVEYREPTGDVVLPASVFELDVKYAA